MRSLPIAILLTLVPAAAVLAQPDTPDRAAEPDARNPPRVLMLAGDGFLASELWEPYFALVGAGYRVDIASGPGGRVKSSTPVEDSIKLTDVNVDDYHAVVIPGGGAPDSLLKFDASKKLVRQFMQRGKIVAALCHGGKLLMAADAVDDRVYTVVWLVKDELPEAWRQVGRRAYVDDAVVVDDNLVTGRCPWDARAFSAELLEQLAARQAGRPDRKLQARVAVINPKAPARLRYAMGTGLAALTRDARLLDAPPAADVWDALVVLPGKQAKKLLEPDAMRAAIAAFAAAGKPIIAVGDDVADRIDAGDAVTVVPAEAEAALRQSLDILRSHQDARQPAATDEAADTPAPDAVLALAPGFDGKVAAAMDAWLRARGRTVLTLSTEAGWVRGLNGTPIQAHASYKNAPRLARDAWIVMPGVNWPTTKNAAAEQHRIDWVIEQYDQRNARLIVFGIDTLELVKRSNKKFQSVAVTGSDQVWWSVRGAGADFQLRKQVVQSDRLITARGFQSVPEVWATLEKQAD